jgi:hypothetical protein
MEPRLALHLQSQALEHWDYRCDPPHLAYDFYWQRMSKMWLHKSSLSSYLILV